ncbi:glutathione S-transferase [Fennellomyces sp. T-0311]|nr:glutathione S-transferase [Fennellomyces sp. T-0311]
MRPTLYGYYSSSATWRLRAMLEWKRIEYEYHPINMATFEHCGEAFRKVNPSMKLPAFITTDGNVLTQSVAILEYIEEVYPERPCLPSDPFKRAHVREICNEIACDIQPLQNSALADEISGGDMEKRNEWGRDRITRGFKSLEAKLNEAKRSHTPGKYCVGDNVTMADFLLVPQARNAKRFSVDMTPYPTIQSINELLLTLPEVIASAPENQPDHPSRA